MQRRERYVKPYDYVGSGQGATVRITEWEPGRAYVPHRTQTLDYHIVLSGEIDVLLDSNEVVHMKRATSSCYTVSATAGSNRTDQPAVAAFILLDAQPIEADGETLKPLYPARPDIN
jgi:hypothetical protein